MQKQFYFLSFQIISAQQLPKINTDKASSIVDPQVWVEIHGVAIDNAKGKTQRIDNNGKTKISPLIILIWSLHRFSRGLFVIKESCFELKNL